MRVTFFCFAKRKSPKKRRPPVCDPFAERRGKPASCRLRGAPWNSLRCVAASFRHPRRVSSRGMGASTPMPTPQPPRRRRSQQGWGARMGHRFARPHLRSARRLRPRTGAERSDGPNGCWVGSLQDAPSTAGCPQRSEGTRVAGCISFAYFSCACKKSKSPPRDERPAQLKNQSTPRTTSQHFKP